MKSPQRAKDSCATTFTFYLLVCYFVVMRGQLQWQHWSSPLSLWRGDTRVHLWLLIDFPWRTLQRAGRETVDEMTVKKMVNAFMKRHNGSSKHSSKSFNQFHGTPFSNSAHRQTNKWNEKQLPSGR